MFLKDVKQGLSVIGLFVLTLCFAGGKCAETTITFWQAGGSEELIASPGESLTILRRNIPILQSTTR